MVLTEEFSTENNGSSILPPNPLWKKKGYCNLNEINLLTYLFAMSRNALYILIFWYFVAYITICYIYLPFLLAHLCTHMTLDDKVVTLVSLDVIILTLVHFKLFNKKLKQDFHKLMIHYAYCKRNKTYCKLKSIMLII